MLETVDYGTATAKSREKKCMTVDLLAHAELYFSTRSQFRTPSQGIDVTHRGLGLSIPISSIKTVLQLINVHSRHPSVDIFSLRFFQ